MHHPQPPEQFTARRIIMVGNSGAGKTTAARSLAQRLGIPHTETDALAHGPGWTRREEFADDVDAVTSGPEWICEYWGQQAGEFLAGRAQAVLWLDYPYWRVTLPRVVLRTLRRRLRREVLWNGNQEGPLREFFTDPEHVVRWSISQRRRKGRTIQGFQVRHPHLRILRFTSPRELEQWMAGLPRQASGRRAAGAQAGRGSAGE